MSAPNPEPTQPKSYLGAWIATLLLIVAFVLGLLAFPPLFDPPSGEASSSVLFVGRFHPLCVHLPVGALGLLWVFELLCLSRRGEDRFGSAALLTLWVGSAGAVLAVLAGIMLSREGGYVSGNFTLHQGMGVIGTAGVLLALVIRIVAMGQGSFEMLHAYRAVFLLAFAIMSAGAHFGGNMSHGNKFLTEHAPPEVKAKVVAFEKWLVALVEKPKTDEAHPTLVAAADSPATPVETPAPAAPAAATASSAAPVSASASSPPAAPSATPAPALAAAPVAGDDDKLVFQDVILPILEAKCNKCHNEDKAKGDLRMDSFELAMKGGENGNNFVPGKPDESLAIQRIVLPVDDDEHMPPDGKDQMTSDEITLLRWWVQQGASNTQKVSDAKMPVEINTAAQTAASSVVKR